MRVANKLTPEPKSKEAEKKKLKILEIVGPKSFQYKNKKFVKTTICTELFT